MNSFCRCLLAVTIWVAVIGGSDSNPGDREQARASFREGNGFLDQARFPEAVAAYSRAIEQDPQYAEAYYNRALAHEMVDRKRAIQDWRRFVELAEGVAELKYDAARVRARLQILEAMLPLLDSMQPTRYVPEAGDYYWNIAKRSDGETWSRLPVRVFLGSAPEIKWQEGAREAFDIWSVVFPLELAAMPQNADIRIGWEESVLGREHAGEAFEWVQVRRVGDQLKSRKIEVIVVDLSRRWSKEEMRAIVLHEMGHALGIKGHSDSPKDILYWRMQDDGRQINVPVIPHPLFWRSLVKRPSQRDVNTLIRLYNSAGPITRFQ